MELLLYRFENIRNTFSYENSTKIDTFFFYTTRVVWTEFFWKMKKLVNFDPYNYKKYFMFYLNTR